MSTKMKNRELQKVHKKLEELERERNALQDTLRNQKEETNRTADREEKLKQELEDQTQCLHNMYKKLDEMERERCMFQEAQKNLKDDMARSLEREEKLKRDLECCAARELNWEDDAESHRAALRNCQLDTDMLKLRIEELEKSLQTERAEAKSKLDKLRKKYRDLEMAYREERANAEEWVQKAQQMETDFKSNENELLREIEEKDKVIDELTNKHGSLSEVKDNLEQVKTRNANLEEALKCYATNLQSLADHYLNPGVSLPVHQGSDPPLCMKSLLDALGESMSLSQNQLRRMDNELIDIKQKHEQKMKEADTFQEGKVFLSRKLKDCHGQMNLQREELEKLREEYEKLYSQMQTIKKAWVADKDRLAECQEQEKLTKEKMKEELKVCKNYLGRVYLYLVNGCEVADIGSEVDNFTFEQLFVAVQESIGILFDELEEEKQKGAKCEAQLKEKKTALRELELAHADALKKMTDELKEQDELCRKEKTDLEHHYSAMIRESQSRTENCQEALKRTREKTAMLERVRDQMFCEISDSRNQVLNHQDENGSLLVACALMAGALYPLYSRACALSVQRDLLQEQTKLHEAVKKKIRALTLAFAAAEQKYKHGCLLPKKIPKSLIHVFRKGVIVVLAANRLQRLGQSSNSLFNWIEGCKEGTGIIVYAGASRGTSGKNEQKRWYELVNWFKNSDLLNAVVTSVSELQKILSTTDTTSRSSGYLIINASKSAFSKLLDKLSIHLTDVPISRSTLKSSDNKGSLARMLAQGLQRSDSKALKECRTINIPVLVSLTELQRKLLDFTMRLQTCEEERQAMREQMVDLNQALEKREEEIQRVTDQTQPPTALAEQALIRKDQQVRQLARRLNEQEEEKRQLEESINQAEASLRKANQDKESLINQIKYTTTFFEKLKEDIMQERRMDRRLSCPGEKNRSPSRRLSLPLAMPKMEHSKVTGYDYKVFQKLVNTIIRIYNLVNLKEGALRKGVSDEHRRTRVPATRTFNVESPNSSETESDGTIGLEPGDACVFTFDNAGRRNHFRNREAEHMVPFYEGEDVRAVPAIRYCQSENQAFREAEPSACDYLELANCNFSNKAYDRDVFYDTEDSEMTVRAQPLIEDPNCVCEPASRLATNTTSMGSLRSYNESNAPSIETAASSCDMSPEQKDC
ncbi:coiled-coil domain-containing protein 171 isoform X2 [Lissotriton helveticus]